MGRILDKLLYKVKEAPILQDYFIGTDSQDNGKTVNFEISSIATLISGAGEPDRIISGAPIWIVGTLMFFVPVITYWMGGNLLFTEPETVEFDIGDDFDPRTDVLAVTIDSGLHIEKGVPSPDPAKPTLPNGNDFLELTFVDIAAMATVPTDASVDVMYDEFVGEPNEYTVTESTGGVRITLDNQVAPNTNLKSIYLVTPNDSDSITLLNDSQIAVNTNDTLTFAIRVETLWRRSSRMHFTFYKTGSAVSNSVTLRNNQFGFSAGIEQEYQYISIPFSEFTFSDTAFDRVDITFTNLDNGSVFRLDTISRMVGLPQPDHELYILPIATTTILGGVKIDGTTVIIDEEGVISSPPSVYTLPIATDVILGGVIVDNVTITVDGAGVISGVAASPFEALDEGAGSEGYIIRGSNRAFHANVGWGALDFGSRFVDSTQGASGTYAVNLMGEDSLASGYGSFVNNGYANVADDPYTTSWGYRNLTTEYGGISIGQNLQNDLNNGVFVGAANIIKTTIGGINDPDHIHFLVGNGNLVAGAPPTAGTRSDAFICYHDGRVINPSLTVALIDAESTGKVTITREKLEAGLYEYIEDRLLENATVTGTYDLDYELYELWNLTLTGATTFTESNLEGKTIIIRATGDFALTFPANWSTDITGTYDGTVQNVIVVQYFKSTIYKVNIIQPD